MARKNQVTLPEPYTQFLTEIGNGGAGPYYGIYSIEKATSYTDSDDALAAKCVLYPSMPKEEWNHLIEPLISDEDIPDSEYDAARNMVMSGLLCIGTQGCEYDMYLVLEGEHKGKSFTLQLFILIIPFSLSMITTFWIGMSAGWMKSFWIMTSLGLAAECQATKMS